MGHPFFTAVAATRSEAIRWLTIAEKLLSARDLVGSKSFAARARAADPTLSAADEILAVVDTILAGNRRIGNNQPDLYSILRLTPAQGGDAGLVADQYRSLVAHLNPQRNRFPFADQAFRLVVNAWSVLSDPSSKDLYDKELGFFQQTRKPDPFSAPLPAFQQNFIFPQPQMQGGESSGIAAANFAPVQPAQVQQTQIGPAICSSTAPPQNFTGLHPGSNIVFGSIPSHVPINNQRQENYSNFPGYYASSASRANEDQLNDNNNNKEKHNHQDYADADDKNDQHACENVQENIDHVEQNVEENIEEVEETMVKEEEEGEEEVGEEVKEEEREYPPSSRNVSTFWTACPYCYYMYEYPTVYVDCTMRCQNCKMAFQCVVIPSPPPILDGQDAFICCWGFIPLGFSMEIWKKNNKGPRNPAPRVYIDDDDDADIFADIYSSSESDIDWQHGSIPKGKKNRLSHFKRKVAGGASRRRSRRIFVNGGPKVAMEDGFESENTTEGHVRKSEKAGSSRKQPNRAAKSYGKLDLNVEFSNEAEEHAVGANKENELGRKEDDSIEGIGFFEGLDELFSNLPILNAVGDDKAVKAA